MPEIDRFLQGIAVRNGWNEASTRRLRSAGEEALLCLVRPDEVGEEMIDGLMQPDEPLEIEPQLIVQARPGPQVVELELLAVFDDENLEDRMAYLSEEAEGI